MSRIHVLAVGMVALALAAGCQDRNGGPAEASLTDTLAARGDFTTLVDALEAADLADRLREEGPFTIFAPTDAAFDRLGEGARQSLLEPENRQRLREVATRHVVPGKVVAIDLIGLETLGTLSGGELNVNVVNGKILINGAVVTQTDVGAANGVIHVIDGVLLPPQP
ncbi:MAG: fasciclin domain-containing protein [Planctomycetes bacterium]|nr:fasciclin domain-containing protein [Planctomycetota bacterium]